MRGPAFSARLIALLWLCYCGSVWADTVEEPVEATKAEETADTANSGTKAPPKTTTAPKIDPKKSKAKATTKKAEKASEESADGKEPAQGQAPPAVKPMASPPAPTQETKASSDVEVNAPTPRVAPAALTPGMAPEAAAPTGPVVVPEGAPVKGTPATPAVTPALVPIGTSTAPAAAGISGGPAAVPTTAPGTSGGPASVQAGTPKGLDTKPNVSNVGSATKTQAKQADPQSGAADTNTVKVTASSAKKPSAPWSGSAMSLNQSVSTLSFDKSSELDYNPYYALTLGLAPSWRFHPKLYVSAGLSFSREITQPDNRNRADEIWLSDTRLTIGTPGWKIPVLAIQVAGQLTSTFATSPSSRAQTLIYGVQPGLSLSRRFGLLQGLTVAYSGGIRVNIHEYTTGELSAPRIATCTGATCAELINTGVRNTQYQQSHSGSLSLGIFQWLSLSTSFGVYMSHLYPAAVIESTSYQPLESTDTRYAVSYGLGAQFKVLSGVSTSVGMSTFNPQRTPDNDQYRPFFNRFSQVYLNMRLTPGAWFE